jgi:hypothetical protein
MAITPTTASPVLNATTKTPPPKSPVLGNAPLEHPRSGEAGLIGIDQLEVSPGQAVRRERLVEGVGQARDVARQAREAPERQRGLDPRRVPDLSPTHRSEYQPLLPQRGGLRWNAIDVYWAAHTGPLQRCPRKRQSDDVLMIMITWMLLLLRMIRP